MTDEPTRVRRWVWISGIVLAIVVLAVVAVLLIGGGHSPGPRDHG